MNKRAPFDTPQNVGSVLKIYAQLHTNWKTEEI